jgi:hypothetical protein
MPSYAVGTPYVPKDGPAFLHEGERVVPKSGNGGWGQPFNVTVINEAGDVATASAQQVGPRELEVMVQKIADSRIAKATRPGGAIRQGLRAMPPDRS